MRGHKINYVTNSIATAIVLLAVVGLGVVALVAILLHEPPETMRSQRMVSTKSQNREHKINVRNLSFKKPVENVFAPVEQARGSVTQEARRMIEQGEDLNAPCQFGYLVLHWATSEGDLPTVKLLIEHGADVNASNVDGFTPLMISAQEDKLEIAKLLIEKGADVNAKSEDGKTALDFAREAGHQDVAELLREHGGGYATDPEPAPCGQALPRVRGYEAHSDCVAGEGKCLGPPTLRRVSSSTK